MDFELSEQQKMFKQAVRDFAEKEVSPLVDEANENEEFPKELVPKMANLGYLGLTYSSKYGGAELDEICECIFAEELGRIDYGIACTIDGMNTDNTSPIYKHGTEEQKQKYIAPMIKGQKLTCLCMTEPEAGSDTSAMQTTATKTSDGYILNGNKIFISGAPNADFMTVAAYTDKSKRTRGMSLFIVDRDIPGITINKLHKVGSRSLENGEVFFDNCHLPKESLIGEEGRGFYYCMEALDEIRITGSFLGLGIAQAAYEAAVQYAQERIQFSQPIGKFQAISFKLADVATDIEATRWLGYHAAWLYEQGRRCIKEASMVKLFSARAAQRATQEAMQIYGGYSYILDSPIQRYWRDARLLSILDGTSEIQQLVISRQIGL